MLVLYNKIQVNLECFNPSLLRKLIVTMKLTPNPVDSCYQNKTTIF